MGGAVREGCGSWRNWELTNSENDSLTPDSDPTEKAATRHGPGAAWRGSRRASRTMTETRPGPARGSGLLRDRGVARRECFLSCPANSSPHTSLVPLAAGPQRSARPVSLTATPPRSPGPSGSQAAAALHCPQLLGAEASPRPASLEAHVSSGKREQRTSSRWPFSLEPSLGTRCPKHPVNPPVPPPLGRRLCPAFCCPTASTTHGPPGAAAHRAGARRGGGVHLRDVLRTRAGPRHSSGCSH